MEYSVLELTLTYKGYKIAIIWHPTLKYRCAYVLIPYWHKLYKQDYGDIPVNCHGGLTYSGHFLLGKKYPGWWIGFDCAHAGDTPEKCDLSYCINECRNIVNQIREME